MNFLISVIVPIYNVERYLPKCVSSILDQTYHNIQIILVDDGSTDNSGRICDEYAEKDSRIEVIHKENGGLVSARKAGLLVATGQYIGFVDGDDYIDGNMYERLLENLTITEADFVHMGYYKGKMILSRLSDKVVDIRQNKSWFIENYILSSVNEEYVSPSIWSKLFKANFIKECYLEVPDSQSLGEDLISLIVCVLKGEKLSIMDSSCYHYCVRNTSITQEQNGKAFLETIKAFQIIESILKRYGCYNEIEDILIKDWLKVSLCAALKRTSHDSFKVQCYGFGNMQILFGKKIVIYGAGEIGRDYYCQIRRYPKCEIVAWIDKNYQNIHYDCFEVTGPKQLKQLDFDVLIVAVKYESNAIEIKKDLVNQGIKEAQILWIKPELN